MGRDIVKVLEYPLGAPRGKKVAYITLLPRKPSYCLILAKVLSVKSAFTIAVVVSFCSFIWPQSRDIHDQLQEACLVTCSLACALGSKQSSKWPAFASGVLLGMAFVTRTSAVLAAPGLLLTLVGPQFKSGWNRNTTWMVVAFACGVAMTGWMWPAYNYMRFGNILLTGYDQHFARGQIPSPSFPTLVDLASWLVSPFHGTLIYIPATLLVPLAAARFARRSPWVLAGGSLTFIFYLVFHASFRYLVYQWSYGPNYLMATIPWLLLPLVALFEDWCELRSSIKIIAICILILSLLVQLPGVIVPVIRTWGQMGVRLDAAVLAWHWESAPIVAQSRDSLLLLGNVFSGQTFDLIPNQETMLNTYMELNVPDWWWVFVIYRGFQPAIAIPVVLLSISAVAVWRIMTLARKDEGRPTDITGPELALKINSET